MSEKIYSMITDQIIDFIEKSGVLPWQKPWNGDNLPMNLVSKKNYRGINNWLLMMKGYSSPYWLTFNQARKLKGSVRKGESGTTVIFWKFFENETIDANGNKTKSSFPMLRYYTVFNIEQCDNIKVPKTKTIVLDEFNPIEEAEKIVENMPQKPDIKFNEQKAYYSPSKDYVNMPKPETFKSEEEYYSTLFHELTHSTGHKERLNRSGVVNATFFGSIDYSKEELVAEFGASFLCGHAGIIDRTFNNSAAYIKGWVKKFKEDKKILIAAAGAAQKASDFILDVKFEKKDK